MRAVLLSKALVVGAYQRKCELIAAHPGVELTVLAPQTWGGQPLERAHTVGYTLRALPIRFDGNFHLYHYPTMEAELRRAAPDVVHIDEEPYNLATYLAMRAARRVAPNAHVLFFSWQNLTRRYPPPFAWMERAVLRAVDAAIVGSEDAGAVWRAKGYAKPLHVLPQFGVDETLFAPAAVLPEKRLFTVGYAGRLVPEKGVDVLLRAMAEAPGLQLHVLGDGPERAALTALAQSLGLGERARFSSHLPSTQMPSFYGCLDALVLPSRTRPNWKEQFGRVLIEAMSCGVPVLGSNSGEIPNVIGDAGIVFAEGDARALADRLHRLRADAGLRARLSAAGRARVLAHYTMRHIAEETAKIWRQL